MNARYIPENSEKNRGYFFLLSALIVVIIGIGTVVLEELAPTSLVGAMIPAGILVYYGFKNVRAGRENVTLTDERVVELYEKTGLTAFWLFVSFIGIDAVFELLPDQFIRAGYFAVAMIAYLLSYSYYRFKV